MKAGRRLKLLAPLCLLAGAVGFAPAASASPGATVEVRAKADSITVAVPGASATIERNPLRISFADGAGRTVLRQLPGDPAAAQEVPAVPRPQFGSQGPPPPTLYAPLTFLVGQVSIDQFPSSQWNGNLRTVTEGGTEYGAVAVEQVRRHRNGVTLVVSTSDPSGRKLIVDVGAGPGPGTIEVNARPSSTAGVAAMGDSFASPAGQAFRGFGGRHDTIDQAGNEFYNWTAAGEPERRRDRRPGPAPMRPIPTATCSRTAKRPPTTCSRRSSHRDRYGFLLDRDELSDWRLASDRADAWQVQAASAPARLRGRPGRRATPRSAL